MDGPVINLRQARKRRVRANASERANLNRIAHGRSAGERRQTKADRDALTRTVDVHMREQKNSQLKPPTS